LRVHLVRSCFRGHAIPVARIESSGVARRFREAATRNPTHRQVRLSVASLPANRLTRTKVFSVAVAAARLLLFAEADPLTVLSGAVAAARLMPFAEAVHRISRIESTDIESGYPMNRHSTRGWQDRFIAMRQPRLPFAVTCFHRVATHFLGLF